MPSTQGVEDGLPSTRRRWSLAAVFCAVALSVLSLSSVSVALPVIATDLGVAPSAAIAVVNIFQLALVATLLPFAALGERIGYRPVFLCGLVLMGVASLACAMAESLPWLVAARVLQALAGSAVMAVNPALLRLSVPSAQLGRAIGLNAMVVALATALGPSIAAFVLTVAAWPWLFALNLPWVLLAWAIGSRALPKSQPSRSRHFDAVGAGLNAAAFVLIFMGFDALIASPGRGVAAIMAGMVVGGVLVRQQRRQDAPLLPLDLLGIPIVRYAVGASVCAFAAQMAALVALPFLLHRDLTRSMVDTGLLIMAWPAAVALMAPVAAWLLERWPSAALCAVGGFILATGLLRLAALSAESGNVTVAGAVALCGIGFGCFQTPNNRSMISATPRSRSGGAGGLQATARLCGQTLGTTVASMAFQFVPGQASRWVLSTAALLALGAAGISLLRCRV